MAIHDNKFLFSKHVSNSELFAVANIRKEEKIIRKTLWKEWINLSLLVNVNEKMFKYYLNFENKFIKCKGIMHFMINKYAYW